MTHEKQRSFRKWRLTKIFFNGQKKCPDLISKNTWAGKKPAHEVQNFSGGTVLVDDARRRHIGERH
jgi:hypothetical protein